MGAGDEKTDRRRYGVARRFDAVCDLLHFSAFCILSPTSLIHYTLPNTNSSSAVIHYGKRLNLKLAPSK